MESELDCTVCVVADANGHIRRFLNSLFHTIDPVSAEIIVVNNGPVHSLDFLEKEFPEIIIFDINIRETMAKTRNRIFPLSRGRYISFWRDEIIFQTDCLFRLIEFLDDNPAVGIAGPALQTIAGQPLVSGADFPGLSAWFGAESSPADRNDKPGSSNRTEVDWLSGAALVINPHLVDEIGFFDQTFPCCEELDYCFRASRAGWHIHLVPEARAVYRYPALKQVDWTWSRELWAGLRFQQKKWLGL